MLLRRVTQHVKDQNWFAVGLDFLIVVVGVFIGLQVSNWNDAQGARAEENRVIAQLIDDTQSAIQSREHWIAETQARVTLFRSAVIVMQSETAATDWTEAQCQAVWASHIMVFQTAELPTVNELFASGGLGTLSSQELRRTLVEYRSAHDDIVNFYIFIRDHIANLIDHHAEAFPRTYLGDRDETGSMAIGSRVACDLDLIRSDLTIRNRMIGNLGRMKDILHNARREVELLRSIETTLGKTPS